MKTSRLFLLVWVLSSFLLLTGCDSPDKVHLGDKVQVSYTASFIDGTIFESSGARFTVGSGQVIAGLEKGVLGMTAGQTKDVPVTPDQWYGYKYSSTNIQKISKLIFDKIKTSVSGNILQIGSIRWVVKWEESDTSWGTLVLVDINPRETWDSLVYKVTLVEKK